MADHPASTASPPTDHLTATKKALTDKDPKSPNLLDRAKEGMESVFQHKKSPRHHKETHGTSDDIDESTPTDAVKGPNVFQRMKEEVEAVIEAFSPKRGSKDPK